MTAKQGYESYETPKTNGASRSGPYSDRGYTMDEAVLVDKAKRTHQETTASAQRAAKVSCLCLATGIWCNIGLTSTVCLPVSALADCRADKGNCCQHS